MSSVSHNSFMNLSETLISLDLSHTQMKGECPENIFLLPNLQELKLSDNHNLTGSFPRYNWTTPLRNLSLSSTRFLIDLPYLTRSLKYLNHLDARNCNFSGPFPALMLGNITQITSLDLSSNNFGGQIPWDSFNLEKLNFLDLSYNNFEGQLPQICGNSTKKIFLCDSSESDKLVGLLPLNLKSLDLSGNLLSGTIPSWLYSLPSLQDLYLHQNQFTGHISEFQYNSLVTLDLRSNKLEGLIPRSIFQQVNLHRLHLSSNNLSGVIHLEQFSRLKKLKRLSLSFNSLSVDSINSITYVLPNTLWLLELSSCNITGFPHSLRSLENLEYLDLSNNRIDGSVPQWLWNVGKDSLYYLNISHNLLTHIGKIPWKSLSYIDLSSNRLQGHLPIPPPSTSLFSISNNQLVGEIPSLFCNLTWIEVLDLSHNSLTEKIPPCSEKYSHNLSTVTMENYLWMLNLHGNQLEGSLPLWLLHCERLEILDVGNNKLNGSFPYWLESLPELQVLVLRSNRFHGQISNPKVRFPFQKLKIMDLSNNELTGLLLEKYFDNFMAMMNAHTDVLEYMEMYNALAGYYSYSATMNIKGNSIELPKVQTMLILIDFSMNNFTGEIPKVIGKLNSLKGLNFSHNELSGLIPPSLENLSNLECLDLSSNKLSGNIPSRLATDLSQLANLNLSGNRLEGPIPRGKQFNTFNIDSYSGNQGLCGFPLPKLCTDDEPKHNQGYDDDGDHNKGMIDWKVVMMGYGSGMVIGISIGYMVLFSRSFDYWFLKKFGGGGRRRRRASSRGRRRSNYRANVFTLISISLKNLRILDLSNNRIDGSVPQWLWNVGKDSLIQLNISHNLLTHIGKIPWKSLSYIDLSSNRLQGHLPIPPPSTSLFSISNNQLVGEISSLFCNLTGIVVLDLSNNNLSGNIPPCFGNFSKISVLDLRMNKFRGMIPPTFAKGIWLRNLNLHGNQLEGPLPQSLVNCELLEFLDVGNSKLNGSFPHWLESLPELQVLILRSNRLSGPLSNPKVRFSFQKLRIMDISNNNFTVVIKGFETELVKIQKLFITIDFSSNSFTGGIPTVIGKLNSLKGLNFSHNKLSGVIPSSLGNLSNLEWLDLSSNELFGNIPLQLAADLYQLERLNLSDNKLEGPIPRGRQFNTFNSYSGNVGLCGFPLSKSCSNDDAQQDQGGDDEGDHNNGMIDWKVVMMGYGSGMVIGISIGYMVLSSRSFNYWFHKKIWRGTTSQNQWSLKMEEKIKLASKGKHSRAMRSKEDA
ncbi:receptor-like protein Cf-9 homolog [Morus notabilis]|uniref:receptor-like protein Cf-9 homolog n=1 Tax=Morus notabilis TaxID=981085 RepID=UPI000CED388C|nr:receptor-like protein Cf-9 homolog [Morus notabilis]